MSVAAGLVIPYSRRHLRHLLKHHASNNDSSSPTSIATIAKPLPNSYKRSLQKYTRASSFEQRPPRNTKTDVFLQVQTPKAQRKSNLTIIFEKVTNNRKRYQHCRTSPYRIYMHRKIIRWRLPLSFHRYFFLIKKIQYSRCN